MGASHRCAKRKSDKLKGSEAHKRTMPTSNVALQDSRIATVAHSCRDSRTEDVTGVENAPPCVLTGMVARSDGARVMVTK